MAALTGDRKTLTSVRGLREFPVLAGAKIFEGSMVAVDANGWARPARLFGAATSTDRIVGRAELRADNTGGANGAIRVRVRCDEVGYYANSASSDLIANKDIGQACYAQDDQTLALTSGSGAFANDRARAGKIHHVLSDGSVGVWFDQ